MTGTCGKCGGPAHYVSGPTYGFWVHDTDGSHLAAEPERHDVNTHIIRDKEPGR